MYLSASEVAVSTMGRYSKCSTFFTFMDVTSEFVDCTSEWLSKHDILCLIQYTQKLQKKLYFLVCVYSREHPRRQVMFLEYKIRWRVHICSERSSFQSTYPENACRVKALQGMRFLDTWTERRTFRNEQMWTRRRICWQNCGTTVDAICTVRTPQIARLSRRGKCTVVACVVQARDERIDIEISDTTSDAARDVSAVTTRKYARFPDPTLLDRTQQRVSIHT